MGWILSYLRNKDYGVDVVHTQCIVIQVGHHVYWTSKLCVLSSSCKNIVEMFSWAIHVQLCCDCIIYFVFFIFPCSWLFAICNYWVPLATCYAFIMASTSPMYFYHTFCIFIYLYIVRWKQINWIELNVRRRTHWPSVRNKFSVHVITRTDGNVCCTGRGYTQEDTLTICLCYCMLRKTHF